MIDIDKIYRVKVKHYKFFLALLTAFMPLTILAQEEWEKDRELEDVQIEIVKDREIKLPEASRNFEKIPPVRADRQNEAVDYIFKNINFNLPDLKINIRPLRIRDEKLPKLYGNYLKAGYGNYNTPYAEAYFNSKRSKDHSYGAHFNYLRSGEGPVDEEHSGSGKINVDLFGKYFTPKATLSGDLGFDQRSYNFYGYPENAEVNKDTLKQYFNDYYLKGSIENSDGDADTQYFIGAQFNYLTDNKNATEIDGQFNLETRYNLSDEAYTKLGGDLEMIIREDELIEQNARHLFRIRPALGFNYEGFKIEAGFNAVYENDTLGTSDKMHFYPTVKASYPFSESIALYAGVGGDIQKNTLKTISEENPFIDSNVEIYHTNKTFDFYGGINTKLNNKLGFEAGFSAATYRNMYYFMNAPDDQSKFHLIYDKGNTAILNVFSELTLTSAEKFRLTARGDYWAYNTDNVDEAWHKPAFSISSLAVYNLFDKLRFSAEAFTMGGIKALDRQTNEAVELDPYFDLNLGMDYLVSDRFSIFFNFNNILAQEYEILYHYPSRGLQFMAGLTYGF